MQLARDVAAMHDGELSFLEGVRRVLSLKTAIGAPEFDDDFIVLEGVNSLSDHLPSSTAKALSSAEWVKQSEVEERALEERYAGEVCAACERLIVKFAGSDA